MASRPSNFTGGFQRVHPDTGLDNNLGPPIGMPFVQGDAADLLPGEASRARLITLRQHAEDMRALAVAGHTHDARIELQRAQARLKQLTTPRVAGGFGLDDEDTSVIDVKRTIARCERDMARLGTLEADRGERARNAGNLVMRCEDCVRGKPGGTRLVEVPPLEVSDIIKKGETAHAALARMDYRRRTLDADAHAVRSASYPKEHCRAKAHATLDILAERGRPNVDLLIEHDGELAMPQAEVNLPLIAIAGKDSGAVIGDARGVLDDGLALLVWLQKGALIKAIDKLLDEECENDAHALSAADRQVKLAEIASDKLMCERHEAALIWHLKSQGDATEFRVDSDPQAILGIALQTVV
jgi:hypothetical protein